MDTETWAEIEETVVVLAESIVVYYHQVWKAIKDLAAAFYDEAFNAYLEAGAPYGETHEGMMRWAGELGEIERMKWEIARLESDHRCLAALREKIHGS